jgi:GT2 family glycosyltransferase
MSESERSGRERLDVSVTVPTIGRPDSLRELLESLAECDPAADEILIIDQSDGNETADLVEQFAHIGVRRLVSHERSVGAARNDGLRAAHHETILITDDDCVVAPSWVAEGARLARTYTGHLITGRVLPGGDPRAIPSIRVDEEPEDYTGRMFCYVLFSNNMIANRSELLAFGGFDERLKTASDNDLCYRWLRAGRPLRYEPSLEVTHNELRTHKQVERRYVEYWRGQGMLYGKHLRAGDFKVTRFLVNDLYQLMRATAGRVLKARPRWTDPRRGMGRGLPAGLAKGILTFRVGEGMADSRHPAIEP